MLITVTSNGTTSTITLYPGQGGYDNGGAAAAENASGDDLSYTGVDVGLIVKVALLLFLLGAAALGIEKLTRRRYRGTH